MLHYQIKGSGKEDLVLLHGLMESTEIWREMMPHLSDEFRLIMIDLPGHGKSPVYGEIHTMNFMAEKVKEVTDEVCNSKIHLLGHSMGGYTTLAFAERFPEALKSITLFFSTYFADTEGKKETRAKSFRIIKEEYRKYVNAGVPNLFNPFERDVLEGKINFSKEIALATNPEGALAAVKGIMQRPDRRAVLQQLQEKILLLTGRHDSAVDAPKTLAQLPDRQNIKAYMLDCGHNGQLEQPEICAAIINQELLHNLPKKLIL